MIAVLPLVAHKDLRVTFWTFDIWICLGFGAWDFGFKNPVAGNRFPIMWIINPDYWFASGLCYLLVILNWNKRLNCIVSWRPLCPHRLPRPVRASTRFMDRDASSCLMYSDIAPAIADVSFSFFFNLLSAFDSGKCGRCIYSKDNGLFITAIFYPVGNGRLMPQDISLF